MQKITTKIDNKEYDISLDPSICDDVRSCLALDFNGNNIKAKELLTKYVEKIILLNRYKKALKTIDQKVDKYLT
jgi:hypothetical protein